MKYNLEEELERNLNTITFYMLHIISTSTVKIFQMVNMYMYEPTVIQLENILKDFAI